MYAIYGHIYYQYIPNVSIYTIDGSYGIGNLQRIRQAALMFARGVPIIYYGTEQGLDGHQANVLERPG